MHDFERQAEFKFLELAFAVRPFSKPVDGLDLGAHDCRSAEKACQFVAVIPTRRAHHCTPGNHRKH